MNRFVIISGCSGSGKSTLLAELARHGHVVVEEPGRRIVAQELASGGSALPWIDPPAFAQRALDLSLIDHARAEQRSGWVFFDRSAIDAATALAHSTGAALAPLLAHLPRYHEQVFLTPPWPEIYVTDDARRHSLADAMAEYDRLLGAYPAAGYAVTLLDRAPVEQRADAILTALGAPPAVD